MSSQASTKESCIPYFDGLWFCYSKHMSSSADVPHQCVSCLQLYCYKC